MKHKNIIVLYGPPGVGKLTVANQLVEKCPNFKLFHVHLLADLISSLFETGTKEFADSFTHLWLFLFKKSLSTDINGLVVTLVYGVQTLEGKDDDYFFTQIIQTANDANADIQFVKLECADDELDRRVQSETRKKFKKMTDIDVLRNLRKKYKVDQQIPFIDSIVIDTTKLSPTETASRIKEELKNQIW